MFNPLQLRQKTRARMATRISENSVATQDELVLSLLKCSFSAVLNVSKWKIMQLGNLAVTQKTKLKEEREILIAIKKQDVKKFV